MKRLADFIARTGANEDDLTLLLDSLPSDERRAICADLINAAGGYLAEPSANDHRELSAADFLRREHDAPPAIWGSGSQILWAAGEPLLIVASPGLGKTTIAQQVALARLRGAQEVLGYEVLPEDKNVLYVAADRPRQAARSLKRMVRPSDRELLDKRLIVWEGQFDVDQLPAVAARLEAGTVFIDTLGAVVSSVSEEETGQRIYHALQAGVRAEVEVCLIHHARKRGESWRGLDEVYGSRWITAVAGSVMMLTGNAGDEVVKLRHVKPPAEALNFEIRHDHLQGRSYREEAQPDAD